MYAYMNIYTGQEFAKVDIHDEYAAEMNADLKRLGLSERYVKISPMPYLGNEIPMIIAYVKRRYSGVAGMIRRVGDRLTGKL